MPQWLVQSAAAKQEATTLLSMVDDYRESLAAASHTVRNESEWPTERLLAGTVMRLKLNHIYPATMHV